MAVFLHVATRHKRTFVASAAARWNEIGTGCPWPGPRETCRMGRGERLIGPFGVLGLAGTGVFLQGGLLGQEDVGGDMQAAPSASQLDVGLIAAVEI